jgi:inward rectifier potassium channel
MADPARARRDQTPVALKLVRPQVGPAADRQNIKAIGVERAPHKDAYHFVLARSWPTFFVLVTLVFVLMNLVFASAYYLKPGSIAHAAAGSFEDSFYFSVQTLATIGYGQLYPVTRYGHIVVTVEAVTGILFLALITGITFNRFSRPSSRVLFSNKIVIGPRNGVPHMMFRMANWRRNRIVEARLMVVLLATERTLEGDVMRRQIDIPLVRSRTGVFFLTWSAMHLIDEKSPFFGPDAMERLRAQNAELYMGLTGFDETIGQTMHARKQYALDDIVEGARFADVLTTGADGGRVIDYRKFHDVVLLTGAPAKIGE